jgi:hypothetical protein
VHSFNQAVVSTKPDDNRFFVTLPGNRRDTAISARDDESLKKYFARDKVYSIDSYMIERSSFRSSYFATLLHLAAHEAYPDIQIANPT